MADETADCRKTEQLAICIRYIDSTGEKLEVCEDFLGFVELPKQDAGTIATAIMTRMKTWGLDVKKLRGQGYDGCSTMAGHVSGVAVRIEQELPNAKYFSHCASHRLNLVIIASCSVPEVRNFMNCLQKLTFFFGYSPKRKEILKEHMKKGDPTLSFADETELSFDEQRLQAGWNCTSLPTLSDTRWLARGDSISALIMNFAQSL